MYINKVFIYGNLTRDPELKALPSGTNVVNIGVATNRVWKNAEGEKKEEVEFHTVVAFGKTAELIAQYLKKGSGVFIEGRLQTRSWEADGVKKYRTEIVAEMMQFGPRSGGADTPSSPSTGRTAPPASTVDEINPDDIPF